MTPKFSRNCACRKCEEYIGDTVKQEETLCNKVKTVREFTLFGNRVSEGGGCDAAVSVRTWCGWVKFRECCELL